MSKRLRTQVVRAVPWSVAESVLNGLAGLALVFTLAWLLTPAEIGQATVALAIVGTIEILAQAGMTEAVVGAKSADTRASDTAFTVVITLSVAAALLCYLAADAVGRFYNEPEIAQLLKVAALILPVNALLAVPTGLFLRKMRAAVVTLRMSVMRIVTIFATALLAYLHFGAWSLVLGTLAGSVATLFAVAPVMSRWPRFRFSWEEFRRLISFGAALSVERLLWGVMTRLFWLVIGYVHGATILGYFQFAQRLIDETANLVQTFAIRFGLSFFAALERAGRDPADAFLKATRLITAVAAPIFTGLALVMPDLVGTIFSAKWQPAVIVAQVAALGWVVGFNRVLVGPALRARGRQAGLVFYAALACAVSIIAALLTAGYGLPAIAVAWVMRHLVGAPWSVFAIRRYLGIPVARQVGAVIRSLTAAALMAAVVIGVEILMQGQAALPRLIAEVAAGAVTYIAALVVIDRATLRLLRDLASDLRGLRAPARQQPAE
ncbi:oligosaccharide flippase family protein [Pseudolabrys sp. FHR47]|uniref:oligosaccharide flippase family protein n=1 Tax=Pseudolabrys sp. FHR47 TaxID=2562284 RepID=UPI00143E0D4B|nr:oligosaccharide flippase family protein [Pseudolabrys sp. FHR47]